MKKAIIVGATSGYGAAISRTLHKNGFYTIGLSRKENNETFIDQHFQITDVANNALFLKEFSAIFEANLDSDTVVFVVGDVVLKKPEQFTEDDLKYTVDVNLGYVIQAMKEILANGSVKNIITFGSQWSYMENTQTLASYCVAKHLLKHFTELLNQKGIRALHFCVPTGKTEKALNVNNFLKMMGQKLPLEQDKWAEPDEISRIIVNELLNVDKAKPTYKFLQETDKWLLKPVNHDDQIDKKLAELKIEQFYDTKTLFKIAKEAYTNLTGKDLNK